MTPINNKGLNPNDLFSISIGSTYSGGVSVEFKFQETLIDTPELGSGVGRFLAICYAPATLSFILDSLQKFCVAHDCIKLYEYTVLEIGLLEQASNNRYNNEPVIKASEVFNVRN